jgi:hypothetical protein
MGGGRYSEQIEGMLEVMLCLPRSAWGLVLKEMANRIGTGALHKIIVHACDESDWHVPKGSNGLFNREKKRKHSGDKRA